MAGNVPGRCPVGWFLRYLFVTKMKQGEESWGRGFLSAVPSKICGGARKSMHSVDVFAGYLFVKVYLTFMYCIKNTFSNSATANECH